MGDTRTIDQPNFNAANFQIVGTALQCIQSKKVNNDTFLKYYMATDFNKDGKTDIVVVQNDKILTNILFPFILNYKINLKINMFENKFNNFSWLLSPYVTEITNPITIIAGNLTNQGNGLNINVLPIFDTPGKQESMLNFSFISNNKIFNFKNNKDFSKEKLLKTIRKTGFHEDIEYRESLLSESFSKIVKKTL